MTLTWSEFAFERGGIGCPVGGGGAEAGFAPLVLIFAKILRANTTSCDAHTKRMQQHIYIA
eukprot:COSAG03_NODE_16143_length_410_cov_1.668810_1_plen_60_part_10